MTPIRRGTARRLALRDPLEDVNYAHLARILTAVLTAADGKIHVPAEIWDFTTMDQANNVEITWERDVGLTLRLMTSRGCHPME